MTQKRIPEIDIMRCICVLWVVAFSHLTDYTVYDISSPPVIFSTGRFICYFNTFSERLFLSPLRISLLFPYASSPGFF